MIRWKPTSKAQKKLEMDRDGQRGRKRGNQQGFVCCLLLFALVNATLCREKKEGTLSKILPNRTKKIGHLEIHLVRLNKSRTSGNIRVH